MNKSITTLSKKIIAANMSVGEMKTLPASESAVVVNIKPEDMAEMSDNIGSFTEESKYYHNGTPIIFQNLTELDNKKPTVVELFSGLGGISIGFGMAGFQTTLGLDIHRPSIETFRKSHPTATAILGDIRKTLKLNGDNSDSILVKTIGQRLGKRKLDVLVAGIPCQGFSMSNRKRNEFDERNYLFYYFLEAVHSLKPKVVMLENVLGLKTLSNGKFARTMEYLLKEAGYNTHHKVLNAANFGVPQIRKRVVFIGVKEGELIPFPIPLVGDEHTVTVKDAIRDLPPLKSGELKIEYSNNKKEISNFAKTMIGTCQYLLNHKAPKHDKSVIKKIENTKQGEPMYSKFKQRIRLAWNKPSPTQVSGGIRPQFQFGHPTQARGLSVRERARIQSIPDNVEIFGGVVQGRVQTGNAVPPLLAKAIGLNIKKHLEYVCSESGIAQKISPNISLQTQK